MNKKMIVAIIVIAILGLGGVVGYPVVKQAILESNPVNHILYSSVQAEGETAVDTTIEINLSLDEEKVVEQGIFYGTEDPVATAKFFNAILGRTALRYDILSKMDYEADDLQMALDLSLLYKDIPALEFGANIKPWEASITAPQMVNGPLYLDIQDVLDESDVDLQLKDIDLSAYLKTLYKKDAAYNKLMGNAKAYESVARDLLEGNVEKLGQATVALKSNDVVSEVPVVQYNLNLSLDDIYDMYAGLAEVAKTDENVKAFILDRVTKIEALVMENQDYKLFDVDKEEMSLMFSEVKASITHDWEDFLDEFVSTLMEEKDLFNELGVDQSPLDLVISIDKKNLLRQVAVEFKSEGLVVKETVTYNAFGDDVVMPEMPTGDDARDILKVVEDETEMATLTRELVTNISSKILASEAVTTLLSDIKTDAELLPESEREATIQQFEDAVRGMQIMLPMMVFGSGYAE